MFKNKSKIFVFFLCFCLFFPLSACSSDATGASGGSTSGAESTSAAEKTDSSSTAVSAGSSVSLQGDGFRVLCLPVGKGDCFLLYTGAGTVLLDTGYDSNGKEIGKYIKNTLGISNLDYMIITHYDKDHVGGADKILASVTCSNFIYGTNIKESDDTTEFFDAMSLSGGTQIPLASGSDAFSFSLDDVRYQVFPCEQTDYADKSSNNSSLIVTCIYQNTSFLFMGDAESARITEFLNSSACTHYDFIKMPYHGAYMKELKDLLAKVTPSYSVITCSEEEPADDDTLKLLTKDAVTNYVTSKGTVLVHSDGSALTVSQ